MNYLQLFQKIQDYHENTEVLFVQSIPTFIKQAEDRIYNTVHLGALRKNATNTVTANSPYLSLPEDWLSAYSLAVVDATGAYSFLVNKDVNFIREAYPNPTDAGLPQYYALFGSQYDNVNEMTFIIGPTPDQAYTVEMHYFYYPPTIVQGQIASFGVVFNGGSGYVNGVYTQVPLNGGNGANATATIVVANNTVAGVTVNDGGTLYTVGDILTFDSKGINAGSGAGFSVAVETVSNSTGTSWLGDNYDPVLFYGAMREAALFMKEEQDIVKYYEEKFVEALGQLKRLGDGLERGDAYRSGQTKLPYNHL